MKKRRFGKFYCQSVLRTSDDCMLLESNPCGPRVAELVCLLHVPDTVLLLLRCTVEDSRLRFVMSL